MNIALQCPIAGGPAVYKARALYFYINPFMEYDDEFTCMQQGYLYRKSRNINQRSMIYPNPSSEKVNLSYNISGNSILQICDLTGRVIREDFLNPKSNLYSFTVHDLENGLYNYRIIDNADKLIDAGQFIVVKD
jgi:hypothetical protein